MDHSLKPKITFENLPQAVAEVYLQVFLIKEKLEEIQANFQPKTPSEKLTRFEVADMFKCDLSTIHNWTKKGILIRHGIGNKVFYKREEVEAAMIPITSSKKTK